MFFSSNQQLATDNKFIWPFFRLAFRPFFWLGTLFSILSIGVWGVVYTGQLDFSPFGGNVFWHMHEMLFGFVAAIIVGFLLSAVQTWTGLPSIKGRPLAVLVFLWCFARVLLAFPGLSPDFFIVGIDLLFLPLAAFALSMPIVRAKMWKNLFFVPILLLMTVFNGLMHFSVLGVFPISFIMISHVTVLMVALLICIMGGRVFPMFTANGTGTKKVLPIAWVEWFSIFSIIASILVAAQLFSFSPILEASIFLIAGLVNFIRAWRWRIWLTYSVPLLWSLHLSYWAICIGLVMLGLEKLQFITNSSLAYHTVTVGGIGLVILSMISRVSLGHTGRPIEVGKAVTFSFALMVCALIVRVFMPIFSDQYADLILVSSMLWILAYSIFLVIYTPALFRPRIDGKNG